MEKLKGTFLNQETQKKVMKERILKYIETESKIAQNQKEQQKNNLEIRILKKKIEIYERENGNTLEEHKTLQLKLLPLQNKQKFLTSVMRPSNDDICSNDENTASLANRFLLKTQEISLKIEQKEDKITKKREEIEILAQKIVNLQKSSHELSELIMLIESEHMLEKESLSRCDLRFEEISYVDESTRLSISSNIIEPSPRKTHDNSNIIS
jgi:hypothetical protein